MIAVLNRRIEQEREAIKMAARYLPFDPAVEGFFRSVIFSGAA